MQPHGNRACAAWGTLHDLTLFSVASGLHSGRDSLLIHAASVRSWPEAENTSSFMRTACSVETWVVQWWRTIVG